MCTPPQPLRPPLGVALQVLEQLGDTLGERHWMYSAALCSTAALHEARGEYTQAISLLEAALELRRQLFSNSSFLYADTAALLAKTLMQQHTAAAAAATAGSSGSSGSSGGGWFGRGGKESNKAGVPADVSRAIGLWQQAIKIVEDSGGCRADPPPHTKIHTTHPNPPPPPPPPPGAPHPQPNPAWHHAMCLGPVACGSRLSRLLRIQVGAR
jgi:tetratricopeptide (TPR) repeat protein